MASVYSGAGCAKIWYPTHEKGFAVPAPEIVRQLVQRFEENLDSYRSGRYKEHMGWEIESTDKAIASRLWVVPYWDDIWVKRG